VLFELLTGEAPFRRATIGDSLSAVLRDDPPALAGTNDRTGQPIPLSLARLVLRCLERRVEERFQSARDLAFALEAVAADGSGSRTGAGAVVATPLRESAWVRGVLIAGIALVAGLGLGWWAWRGPAPEPSRLHALTYSGSDAWPAASPDGKLIAFASERDGRSRIWLRQTGTGDEVALTAGPDSFPRFSPDGASIVFVRRRADGGSDLWRVPTLGGEPRRVASDVTSADWSPDGASLALLRGGAGAGWSLSTLAVDRNGEEQRLLEDRLQLDAPRWSPDGRHIALLRSGSIRGPDAIVLVDPATRKRENVDVSGIVWAMTWTPAGELLYALAEGAGARLPSSELLTRAVGSTRTRTSMWVPFTVQSLEVLGAGTVVLTALNRRQNLEERGATIVTTAEPHWLSRGTSVDRQPVYSPGGEWVAFASTRGGNLDLWEVSTRSGAVRRLTDDPREDWDPAFTPDGRHLIWSSNRSGHFEVWMAEADGNAPRQLTHDGVDAENPSPSRNGWLVYVSGKPDGQGIWKMRLDGTGAARLVAGADAAHPELSPDGDFVLFHARAGENEEVRVVRLDDGKPAAPPIVVALNHPQAARVLDELNISVGRARWRPDGRAILFVGFDPSGRLSILEQPFALDAVEGAALTVVPSEGDAAVESFGLSSDGERITVSFREQASNLMIADGVPGIGRRSRELP
jgi:Tol biopolymer transport system component